MGTVIVHGPMACGKSRNADALAARFGCNAIIDDWMQGDRVVGGALHLTYAEPRKGTFGATVVDFTTLGLSPATGVDISERKTPVFRSGRF